MKTTNIIQRLCLFLFVLVLALPAAATDYGNYGYEIFRSRKTVNAVGKKKPVRTLRQGRVEIKFSNCNTTSGTGSGAIYELAKGSHFSVEVEEGYAVRWIILRDTEGGERYSHPDGIKRISSVTSDYEYYFEWDAISRSRISGGNQNNLNDDDNNIVVYRYAATSQTVIINTHNNPRWDQFKVRDIIVGYVKVHKVRFEKDNYDVYYTYIPSFKPDCDFGGHDGEVWYKVNDTNIATVDNGGEVNFRRPGTVVLTATFEANKSCAKAQCSTTVNMMRDRVTFTAEGLPDVIFSNDSYNLREYLNKRNTQSGRDFDQFNSGFSVTSSNPDILRYDGRRLKFGGTSGEATITLRQEQNNYYEATTFSHTFIVMRCEGSTVLIKDANEWKLFCKLVNEKGLTRLNARLEAEIDLDNNSMMVGTNNHKYAGTFDGNGHTLTVHVVGTGQGTAPFHRTDDATIKNLTIAGTVTAPANTDNYHTAGLVGFAESTTLRNCIVKADIHLGKTGDQYSGGLIGHILSGNTTIEDCAFIGSITGDKGNVSTISGLIAWGDAGTTTISNSYVNATYTKVSGLNPILRRHKGTTNNLNHVYYSEKSKGINPDHNKNGNLGEQVTADQLKNGYVAYNLQNGRNNTVWGQVLGTNDEPLLTTDGAKRVRKVEFTYNNRVKATRYATHGKAIYGSMPTFTAKDLLGSDYNPHHYYTIALADNFSASTTITSDRTVRINLTDKAYYTIASKEDWKAFCDLVNGGQTKLDAKMTADVDLGGDFKTIGGVHKYSGTFDGQGHTLTVNWAADNAGLKAPFGYVDGATIKNLRTKGKIQGNYGLAGLIYSVYGNTTVSGCVSEVDIKGAHGLAGMIYRVNSNAKVTMTDCVVKGDLTATTEDGKKYMAGFIYDIYGGKTLTNCLYIGTNNATGGCTFGWGTLTNCYYLNACGEAQGTKVTEEQLKSGEVAYKLQNGRDTQFWGQDLDTDNEPQLTADAAKKVYQVAFTYNNEVKAARYANSGKTVSLPTIKDFMGTGYNPHHYYTIAFAGGFNGSTTVDADRTVTVTLTEKDCYDIASKEDWRAFRELVNEGQTAVDAKLTQDVNLGEEILMLGYYLPNVYSGTFDGQGHTLSFSWDAGSRNEIAPFKNVKDATIRNLRTQGKITSSGYDSQLSGLINYAYGNTTISGCVSEVDLKGESSLAGILQWPDDTAHITINDCLVKGNFHATSDLNGGTSRTISGFIVHRHKDAACTLNNCLYLGTNNASPKPSDKGFSSFTFCSGSELNEGTGFTRINNCYYLNACGEAQGTQVTKEQLASGEVAKLLQADRTDQCHWAQPLGEEPSPYREAGKAEVNYVYYNKENNSWVCDDFRLTDGHALPIGIDFTATKATYDRTLAAGKATLCLPYELSVQGFKAYILSGGNGSAVRFAEAKNKLEAYKPYLITADGTPQLGGENIEVKAFNDDKLTTPAGKYKFVGTVTGMDNATAAAANAYILQADGMFHKVTTEHPGATVPAYRAYIQRNDSGAKQLSVIIDDETTGIGDVPDGTTDSAVYDLQGRRMADQLDDNARRWLPAGVYIVNGRKIILK